MNVLNHSWIVKQEPNSKEILSDFYIKSFKKYCNEHKLKKAVLTFIDSRLNDSYVKNLKEIFENLDENNGTLNLNEIKKEIKKYEKKVDDLNNIFKSLDSDDTEKIDFTEFWAACINQKNFLKEERLNEAFQILDKDKSWKITKDEIKNSLK